MINEVPVRIHLFGRAGRRTSQIARVCLFGFLLAAGSVPYTLTSSANDSQNESPVFLDAPSPLPVPKTLFIEQMTWMQVRDSIRSGNQTIIIPTGGIEQNGPFVQLNKHDIIARDMSRRVAERLGDALVAPVISFVPEGKFDPPSSHMRFPGTIGVREETFEQLLTDVAASMKLAGFRKLVLLGDSYDNQQGLKAVAGRLDAEWKENGVRVRYIPEFYDPSAIDDWLRLKGYKEEPPQVHESLGFTIQLLAIEPEAARASDRARLESLSVNGVPLSPLAQFIDLGRQALELRTDRTVNALKAQEAAEITRPVSATDASKRAVPK